MTAIDRYRAHLTARAQRLLAVEERAEREGDAEASQDAQEALRRMQVTIRALEEDDAMRGPDDDVH